MRYSIALFAVMLASPAMAAQEEAPRLLAAPPPKTARVGEALVFRTAPSYHFNLKAPQECGPAPALDVTKASLKCLFASAGEQEVSLKICDDKETACMFEDFSVTVLGRAPERAKPVSQAKPEEEGLKGFLLNTPEAALAEAKKENKPVFIDFFAKWCPPCRLMEDTVLWQPGFMDSTRNMIRISLDADRPAARQWLKHFNVHSYPTYLIADSELREIGRWVGSGSLPAFTAWVKDQERWKDEPMAGAEAMGDSLGAEGKMRLARQYLMLGKWKEARAMLGGMDTRAAAYLDAQAQAGAEDSTDTVKLAALYRGLIEKFDGHDGMPAQGAVLDWITALHKADPAAALPYINGLPALLKRLEASPAAAAEGYTTVDIVYQAATDMGDAGQAVLSAALFSRAAKLYGELADKAARPELAKGLRLSQGRCLAGAGRYGEAEAVYAGLAGKFPDEYAFHRSYAGILLKLKKYPEALREASLSESLSYGPIHSNIVMLKARIQLEMKDKPAALSTLRSAIAAAKTPGESAGLEKYLKSMEKDK